MHSHSDLFHSLPFYATSNRISRGTFQFAQVRMLPLGQIFANAALWQPLFLMS